MGMRPGTERPSPAERRATGMGTNEGKREKRAGDPSLSILRATLESTADAILTTDRKGRILHSNALYLRIWPLPDDPPGNREHMQVVALYAHYLKNPQDILDRTAHIYAAWPEDSYDLMELLDGRVFERISRVQYAGKRCLGRVWSFRDITARLRAEEALRESGERQHFMAEALPLKIFTTRPDGVVDYFNRQWRDYAGSGLDRLRDWGTADFIHPDDAGRNAHGWRHALATGTPFQMEIRLRGADGTHRWHRVQVHPRHDAHGRISMWLGSSIDIDDLKRSEEEKQLLLENERSARGEAEQASRMKDEFLATLSHELRTPLNAILGWAQLLSQTSASVETLRQGLEVIERNARAQNRLIKDLLEMSGIVSGKIRLDLRPMNLAEALEAAIESISPAMQAKEIQLARAIDSAPGAILGDPDRIQQVLWNLLANAVKFTPRQGRIEVILRSADSQAEITIRDSGIGIRPEFLLYIFDRFRQADSSLSRHHDGLGLGLAIVKQLVILHGGAVYAESAGEGLGASFIVTLPRTASMHRDRSAAAAPDTGAAADRSAALRGVRVLVVDDEPDSLELVAQILADRGAGITTAAGAVEGLALLKRSRPDVMVSDIGMPGRDGYQLIRDIRRLAEDEGGYTPAIALTAFADDDGVRAMSEGYQMHLSKPVEPNDLITAIGSLARGNHPPAAIPVRHAAG